ncbi:MAG: SufE family protein [bacterium]|nr:SufE family protein [bacterium]
MSTLPPKLTALIDELRGVTDRYERAELLIEIADRFPESKVTPEVAQEPYPEDRRAPACESDAFVWGVDQPDGTVKFYFDVLNPQGLSAKAMSVILDESASGAPLEQVAALQDDVVFDIFGKELSMGKGAGLMGILAMVRQEARKRMLPAS